MTIKIFPNATPDYFEAVIDGRWLEVMKVEGSKYFVRDDDEGADIDIGFENLAVRSTAIEICFMMRKGEVNFKDLDNFL